VTAFSAVMAGLAVEDGVASLAYVTAIHPVGRQGSSFAFVRSRNGAAWMPGTSPGMT